MLAQVWHMEANHIDLRDSGTIERRNRNSANLTLDRVRTQSELKSGRAIIERAKSDPCCLHVGGQSESLTCLKRARVRASRGDLRVAGLSSNLNLNPIMNRLLNLHLARGGGFGWVLEFRIRRLRFRFSIGFAFKFASVCGGWVLAGCWSSASGSSDSDSDSAAGSDSLGSGNRDHAQI
jgi:hypothetical protein